MGDNDTLPSNVSQALAEDFTATVSGSLNTSPYKILPYTYVTLNVTTGSSRRLLSTAIGVTTTLLGNVSEVVDISDPSAAAATAAAAFYTAAKNGSVVNTALQQIAPNSNVPAQTITQTVSPQPSSSSSTGKNGASSVPAASLLVASAITALTVFVL